MRQEALRRHETPANIHGVIWAIDPDTGADMTVLTTGTLEYIQNHAEYPIEVKKVPTYVTELADGSVVESTRTAYVDIEIITSVGSTTTQEIGW